MSSIFRQSSLHTTIVQNEATVKLYNVEFRDIIRGFCGALVVALPLHFTMEMWERARVIPYWDLAIVLVLAYFANVGFNIFSSFKREKARRAAWFDALEAMGIGLVASAITMLLIEQISPDIPFWVTLKVIALEAVPTSFGASLAKNQLGAQAEADKTEVEDMFSADVKKIMGATLGALLFSFNIAPTIEPVIIASALNWYHLIGIILFSLLVSYLMIFVAGFVQKDDDEGGIMGSKWAETIIAYVISLIMSAFLLWMFGYLSISTPLAVGLPWVVVLGYVTSLGGSAGRLIL